MTKVVYNACYGGFSLSHKAAERLIQLGIKNLDLEYHWVIIPDNIERHNPLLVQVVEELGDDASGRFADLRIAEIKGNRYIIQEYDGYESIQTPEDIYWVKIGLLNKFFQKLYGYYERIFKF